MVATSYHKDWKMEKKKKIAAREKNEAEREMEEMMQRMFLDFR